MVCFHVITLTLDYCLVGPMSGKGADTVSKEAKPNNEVCIGKSHSVGICKLLKNLQLKC